MVMDLLRNDEKSRAFSTASSCRERTFTGLGYERQKGFNWLITALFLIGYQAGSSLVAIPAALGNAGLIGGTLVMVSVGVLTTWTAVQLGTCWTIMQELWPEYRQHCRQPYPEMGYRAIGIRFKHTVSSCVSINLFGICVVLLLLVSKNVSYLLQSFFNVNINFCFIILIIAILLLPLLMLKSPEDFWQVVMLGMLAAVGAVVLILIGVSRDMDTCSEKHYGPNDPAKYPPLDIMNFFLSFGTSMYCFGGHSVFPTVQVDMRKPWHWNRAIILCYAAVGLGMYFPVAIVAYLTYGNSLHSSIIPSIQTGWVQDGINLLITLHILFALATMFNPISQEFEQIFNVPQEFCWKRVATRTGVVAVVVFVAESVPNFGPILDLLGGSVTTMLAIICPSLFHLYLTAAKRKVDGKNNERQSATLQDVISTTKKWVLALNIGIIIIGILCGTAATFAAVRALTSTHFKPPCYVLPFLSHAQDLNEATTYCCGPYNNLTTTSHDNGTNFCIN